jgi:hypothetical protein
MDEPPVRYLTQEQIEDLAVQDSPAEARRLAQRRRLDIPVAPLPPEPVVPHVVAPDAVPEPPSAPPTAELEALNSQIDAELRAQIEALRDSMPCSACEGKGRLPTDDGASRSCPWCQLLEVD